MKTMDDGPDKQALQKMDQMVHIVARGRAWAWGFFRTWRWPSSPGHNNGLPASWCAIRLGTTASTRRARREAGRSGTRWCDGAAGAGSRWPWIMVQSAGAATNARQQATAVEERRTGHRLTCSTTDPPF